ncbi:hypothetical protein [Corynebacterium sp. ACRPH]|uniref:hypothetical protein n=1 Tax=Corynebacterium sp. ACRPH TaxID=2918199 RepID=UPI001EF1673A|nr:hypothetical protein [Corynebacterium sp. ACRPH]MCG7456851.1 hypothetical protein [Corynebacterium sp. ACRPH]
MPAPATFVHLGRLNMLAPAEFGHLEWLKMPDLEAFGHLEWLKMPDLVAFGGAGRVKCRKSCKTENRPACSLRQKRSDLHVYITENCLQ